LKVSAWIGPTRVTAMINAKERKAIE